MLALIVIVVVMLAMTKPSLAEFKRNCVSRDHQYQSQEGQQPVRISFKTLSKQCYDLVVCRVIILESRVLFVGIVHHFFKLYGNLDIGVDVHAESDNESNEEMALIRELERKLGQSGSSRSHVQAQLDQVRERKKTVDEHNAELKNEIRAISEELYRIGRSTKQSANTRTRLQNEIDGFSRDIARYTSEMEQDAGYMASLNSQNLDREQANTTNSVNQLQMDISTLSTQYNELNEQLNSDKGSTNSPPLEFNLLPSQLLDDYE